MSMQSLLMWPVGQAAPHLLPFSFRSIALTHPGRVRANNEDAFLERPEIGLWAVADGMGGHSAGDIASALVIDRLKAVARFATAFDFRRSVRSALIAVNRELYRKAERELLDAIGATVVSLIVHRGHYACIWAGDCRAYLLRDGALRPITRDHSVVQELVDAGRLTLAEARSHRAANLVTRAVGARPNLELDGVYGSLEVGDRLLLCSDGLGVLSESEVRNLVSSGELPAAAENLMKAALDRGAPDNVTLILVEPIAS